MRFGTCRLRSRNISVMMYIKNDITYFAFIFSKLLKELKKNVSLKYVVWHLVCNYVYDV
jgi:hypothetical protein